MYIYMHPTIPLPPLHHPACAMTILYITTLRRSFSFFKIISDAFITLFGFCSSFIAASNTKRRLINIQLLYHVSVVAPMVYQVRQPTHKAEVASSNPGHVFFSQENN